MTFEEMKTLLTEQILQHQLVTATISRPRMKSNEIKRIKLKPLLLKNHYHIQIEYQYERILKHENILLADFPSRLEAFFEDYRQAHIDFLDEKVHVQLSKKNKVLWKSDKSTSPKQVNLAHNRKKNYLLSDDQPYPFLIRLGVQTEEGKVKKQKYDKFKQINRFIEFIDDALSYLPQDRQVRILDFGSGKSYLTFALYHYLKIEKGLDIRVTGLDLKKRLLKNVPE